MPEIAAAFAVGFILNWIFLVAVMWREWRIEKSLPMQRLQRNLAQQNLLFSNSQDAVVSLDAERPPSQIRTLMFLGVFCSMISWPGLVFAVIIVLSLEALAHKERKIFFASPLAQQELQDPLQIRNLLQQYSESFRRLDKK